MQSAVSLYDTVRRMFCTWVCDCDYLGFLFLFLPVAVLMGVVGLRMQALVYPGPAIPPPRNGTVGKVGEWLEGRAGVGD